MEASRHPLDLIRKGYSTSALWLISSAIQFAQSRNGA